MSASSYECAVHIPNMSTMGDWTWLSLLQETGTPLQQPSRSRSHRTVGGRWQHRHYEFARHAPASAPAGARGRSEGPSGHHQGFFGDRSGAPKAGQYNASPTSARSLQSAINRLETTIQTKEKSRDGHEKKINDLLKTVGKEETAEQKKRDDAEAASQRQRDAAEAAKPRRRDAQLASTTATVSSLEERVSEIEESLLDGVGEGGLADPVAR